MKQGLYIYGQCWSTKPEEDFPQHCPTSGKFTRFECCEQCLDDLAEKRVTSGVCQKSRDRNTTRSLHQQRHVKVTLEGKAGYDEYCYECDAAIPVKKDQSCKIRHSKEGMAEKLHLVDHD